MNLFGYYNGKYGDIEALTVPFQNRALYFGDGCYDASFIVEGRVLFIQDHIDRFFNSMAAIKIRPDFSKEDLKELIEECARRSGTAYGLMYWQCDRGTAPRQHCFPPESVKPDLLISVNEKDGMPDVVSPGTAITFEDKRGFYCNIKTLNLLPNVLANQAAKEANVSEAIFVRPDGTVTEGSHTNVCIIKNRKLITHEDGEMVLPGITRKYIMKLAREASVDVEERSFSKKELMEADEIFITGSSTFTKRIMSVDGIPVGMKDDEAYAMISGTYMKLCKTGHESG
ncbi:MAG: aminotransferase class IV [Lachnospiraceae bacterium]|nr:aminotransferase class IV [Lachnospiraceae bacterium]